MDVLRPDLFAPEVHWADSFPAREGRDRELEILAHLFPLPWREETFGTSGSPRWRAHPLASELLTLVGRTRLLDIAAALRVLGAGPPSTVASAEWRIPMQGSLRRASHYEHAWSECLVASLLGPVGEVVWQPPRRGPGPRADYLVQHRSGRFVAEVKRIRVGRTTQALHDRRHRERFGQTGFLLDETERRECLERDAPRLYRRVRHAARQLAASADEAMNQAPGEGRVPGVLFLDVDANPYLLNLRPRLRRWMRLYEWASSIDGIVGFNYRGQEGRAGTVAEVIYARGQPRSLDAMEAIFFAYPLCEQKQIHVAGLPEPPCTFPIGL